MFPLRPGADKREALLAQAKAERLARSGQKQKEQQDVLQEKAACIIQSFWKRVRSRAVSNDQQRSDWDMLAVEPIPQGAPPAEGLVRNLKLAFLLLRFCDPQLEPIDGKRLALLCRILLSKTVLTPAEIRTSLLPTSSSPSAVNSMSPTSSPPGSPAQQAVAVAVRTQMFEKGIAIVNKVLNSGQFYKDIRTGVRLRVEALTQLQDRLRRTSLTSLESAKLKSLTLWITAIWRCCVLFQSVDKDIQDKPLESDHSRAKINRQTKDNLINLYSDDSTIVGITCNVLTIPLFVECLDDICIQLAWKHSILRDILEAIMDNRHQQYILSSMSLNGTLSLLGNLIQLYRIHLVKNADQAISGLKNRLVDVVVVLLTRCQFEYADVRVSTVPSHLFMDQQCS
ncbi:hypothetical protein BGW38_009541 [Lunasporangiospora selenospora]|uniref:Uncharacterized protein n=1 Tax=Lunasporangiospora selenospora TaxID=979761 RepID=A0A9P6KFW7_9FUNG|nr:hypothetical protein BGW38_009541 [Lunasporangiospora selenospora]